MQSMPGIPDALNSAAANAHVDKASPAAVNAAPSTGRRSGSQRKVLERARLANLERNLKERLVAVACLLKSAGAGATATESPHDQSSGMLTSQARVV